MPTNIMRAVVFFKLTVLFFIQADAQTYADKQRVVQKVFDNIVNAYGNAKAAPLLKLLPNMQKERVVAAYSTTSQPSIKVDEQLVDICFQLKADSLNALAIIISHELAHYYNDHTFCSDYAYAIGNTSLSKALRTTNKVNKLEKETEADYQGLWHAAMAGYYAFDIFDKLVDKIYSSYKLPEAISGYPTKTERKSINKERHQKVSTLIPVFEAGTVLTQIGKYEEAADCFDEVIRFFPSRENYNNAGVAKLLAALQLKPKQAIEFIYPIELDAISRLQDNTTRSLNEEQEKKLEELLLAAKQNFEKAISLDAAYTKAYINIACVLDIMGNPEGAIGKLNELPTALQNDNTIQLIKGIAYYHADNNTKAGLFFNKLLLGVDSIVDYNLQLYWLSNQSMTTINSFTTSWQRIQQENTLVFPDSLKKYFENFTLHDKTCVELNTRIKLNICANKTHTEMQFRIGNIILNAVSFSNNSTIAFTTKDNSYWLVNIEGRIKKWLIKQL